MKASARDNELLHEVILQLHSHRDLKRFRDELPALMLRLIPADYFCWNEILVDPVAQTFSVVDFVEYPGEKFLRFTQRIAGLLHEHPFTRPFLESPQPTALKFTDFYTLKQLRQNRVYQLGFAPEQMIRQLAIPVWLHPALVSSLNFNRQRQDFSERDRDMLNRIAPHFKLAYQHAELASASAKAMSKSLIAFQLTPREAEIALWLAEGKSNPEIAAIFGLSPRTVEKNMEKILEKMGVENRTAAALMIAKAN